MHDPMRTGDGWLVRVKPPAGRLTAQAASALAAACLQGGNGVVQVTQHGNLQFRGFSRDTAASFAATAVSCGVADADRGAERRRRVIAAPLGSKNLPLQVEAMLDGFALADKFTVLVDDAARLRLEGVRADIGIRVDADRVRLTLDGASCQALCSRAEMLPALHLILEMFMNLADGEGRMRDLLEDLGETVVFLAAGLAPVEAPAPPADGVRIGDLGDGVFSLALPYGQMPAASLAALAAFAARYANGMLRPTPWRTVVLSGLEDTRRLAEGAHAWGLITDPDDARLAIVACPGRPACASGLADTYAIADLIARDIERLPSVHVSGCAKACAHPGPAAVTLVGEIAGISLVRHGRAGDAPAMAGLAINEIAAALAEHRA